MLQEYERFPQWLVDVEEGKIWSKKYNKYIGSINKKGYVYVSKPPKGYKHRCLHQYIWMCVNGDILEGYDIHHKDHNKLNNSIYNLELVEHNEHTLNHNKEKKIIFIGENNPFYGKHHTDETKRKISETHKGENNHFYGKRHTEETKRKISEANKGTISNKRKQVAQYTLEGELVKIWNSVMECGRNGFNNGHITECCNGKRKTHKKFKWKYKYETEL